jgi:hypothetical protein
VAIGLSTPDLQVILLQNFGNAAGDEGLAYAGIGTGDK